MIEPAQHDAEDLEEPVDAHDEEDLGTDLEVLVFADDANVGLHVELPSLPELQHGGHKERKVERLKRKKSQSTLLGKTSNQTRKICFQFTICKTR